MYATNHDYELCGLMVYHSSFGARRVLVGERDMPKIARDVSVSMSEGSLFAIASLCPPHFPIPEMAGCAAGNFNPYCHSTRLPKLYKKSW